MEVYVVDSHALLWFLTRNPKLSPVARQILKQAEVGEVMVFVPTIVLAELDNIVRQKNLEITLFEIINKAKEGKELDRGKLEKEEIKIEEIIDRIEQGDGFAIADLDLNVVQRMIKLPRWENHDKIIAATAIYLEAKLITKNEVLQNADEIETVWD